MIEVSLNILLWNGENYLGPLFDSIRKQTYPSLTVRLLDNGSTDGTMDYVRAHAPEWLVARNVKNLGFARGQNQLMTAAIDRYAGEDLSQKIIIIANQDMVFEKHLVERLVAAFEKHPDVNALQPKLLRAFSEDASEDLAREVTLSDIIDTTGLKGGRNWRCEDRGAGEKDVGQYDAAFDILGPSGALAAYRVSALVDVASNGEYFDNDFNSYREDCDLALRLRRAGHKTRFVPEARGWHHRGMYGAAKRTLWQRLWDRRAHNAWRRAVSTRNQLFALVKNLSFSDAFFAAPWIIFHEGGRVAYALLFEGETRRLLVRSVPLLAKMWKKRAAIMQNAREESRVIRAYMH